MEYRYGKQNSSAAEASRVNLSLRRTDERQPESNTVVRRILSALGRPGISLKPEVDESVYFQYCIEELDKYAEQRLWLVSPATDPRLLTFNAELSHMVLTLCGPFWPVHNPKWEAVYRLIEELIPPGVTDFAKEEERLWSIGLKLSEVLNSRVEYWLDRASEKLQSTNGLPSRHHIFRANFKMLCKLCKWSVRKLAEKAGIDYTALYRWRNGQTENPGPENLKAVADAFRSGLQREITVEDLYDETLTKEIIIARPLIQQSLKGRTARV